VTVPTDETVPDAPEGDVAVASRSSALPTARKAITPRGVFMTVLVLVLLGVAYWLPTFYEAFRVRQLSNVLTFSLAVLGLALLTGFNGQISIGQGAFFGTGAYTTAILVADHGWNHLATIPAAALISFALGILVGLPALRIKGLYLALVTLALATLFPVVIQRFSDLTGGTQGKGVPPLEAPSWSGLQNDQWIYYVQLVFLVVACLLVRNLVNSRVGRGLIAIRDNDIAAEVVGVNVAAYRVTTFGVSAMLAGIGGALWVFSNPYVDSNSFTVTRSIQFLAAMVIGGATSILGPILGSFFIQFVPEYAGDVNAELSNVIYGCLLIVLMLVLPGGFLGGLKRIEAFVLRKIGRTRDWRKPKGGESAPPVLADPLAGGEAAPEPAT
jgi:branched-chain amino acid transport system permease protein